MWTPKRIVWFTVGTVLTLAGYLGYAACFGSVDGLPPLPREYWPSQNADPVVSRPRPAPLVVKKLEEAFGVDCAECKRPIKIDVQARGLVLAAQDFQIEKDGRVRLSPLSVAIYGKHKADDGTPEINTIRADEAYLTFERPINNVADMGKHRIVAAQIAGNIRLVNNRRSRPRTDDMTLDVPKGPLYYRQEDQVIWTDDFVEIHDYQSQPQPTRITGYGMKVELAAEAPAPKPGQPRPAAATTRRQVDNITGVKRVALLSAVDMHLFVDSKSGFLSTAPSAPARSADPKKDAPAQKTELIIKTPGSFSYDLTKEFARFDVPERKPTQTSKHPDQVQVVRITDPVLSQFDTLVCEHLELQFRRRPTPAAAARKTATTKDGETEKKPDSASLEVETARAHGGNVTLTSDTEVLEAYGKEFTYDARDQRTILKGKPMAAVKEGNTIEARELQLQGTKETGQTATALGPGKMSLRNKGSHRPSLEAVWKDRLVTSKDGKFDVLHLIGQAAFIDLPNEQRLDAEELKVWLHPADEKDGKKVAAVQEKGKDPGAKSSQESRRPDHLIATGHVEARSPEYTVHDAARLVVWFQDAPPAQGPPPPPVPAKPVARPAGERLPTESVIPPVAPPPGAEPRANLQKPGTEKKEPIHLRARTVETHVLRVGQKSQLKKLKAEGAVHVTQAPGKPGDKGVDITGETLNLTANPEGNFLVVTGDLARLEMDTMLILGPEVNIDQGADKAWVNGIGAMTMESESDFQGKKLKKPSPLTVHWNKSMYFNGKFAEFHGGIQADQDNARLACQSLQVFFDRPVSLKQGRGKEGQERAKVRNLVCDKSVRVEDSVVENGKLVKYQQLVAGEVNYDNEEAVVQASGPGEVRLLQEGSPGDPVAVRPGEEPRTAAKPAANGKKAETVMKLTYVQFHQRMYGNNHTNTVKFYTNVRVLHMPGDNPRIEIDLDEIFAKRSLPKGALYMRCDQLHVYQRPREKGKPTQEMEARGRVSVEAEEFSGKADRVIYDEEKDQVIFDGGDGLATLYKVAKPGGRPEHIQGRKIIYSRRTGEHSGIDIRSIDR